MPIQPMTRREWFQRPKASGLALLFILLNALPAACRRQQLHIDYTVEISNPATDLFHVTANIQDINQPRLNLSLPVWTPGWYAIENYAKNIQHFKIRDESGASLSHIMQRKQRWTVDTEGHHQIKVTFDYKASVLAVNQAMITKEFAFFTGTQLFLMAEGHRASPSTVRFMIPRGWKIISALKETADPLTFTAPDYDTLVDAPTEMGHFDVTRFEAQGKPHYLVTTPAGAFAPDKAHTSAEVMAKIASTAGAMFGGLPYEKYIYFYFLTEPEHGMGGLEHLNSFVFIGTQPELGSVPADEWEDEVAHEYFHLWNVKRIRPIEMWPYDYSRENETPLLWVSEGFTNYYADLICYRAGLSKEKSFLVNIGLAIRFTENGEARAYISPAESSVSTWVAYAMPGEWPAMAYYMSGEDLAVLLDLSIRHDTHGALNLDDAMQVLYKDFYEQGKGFSTEDLIGVINRLTKRDYHDFFRRYVWGVEVPPYDQIFGYAGYRIVRRKVTQPVVGFDWRPAPGEGLKILSVNPASPADAAGLAVDDVILKADAVSAGSFGWYEDDNAGKTLNLTIRRAGEERQLKMTLGARDQVGYDLVEMPHPTADQLNIRQGWLKRSN